LLDRIAPLSADDFAAIAPLRKFLLSNDGKWRPDPPLGPPLSAPGQRQGECAHCPAAKKSAAQFGL